MKVGILTVHRAINIGAVLQTYALQEILKSFGHDAYVINYVQEKVERTDREKYDLKKRVDFLFHLHLRGFLTFGSLKNRVASRYKIFDDFLLQYLRLTPECDKDHIPQDFDAYVIGSDQLWNSNIFGYHDDVFWGNFKRKVESKVFAYADSTTVENIKSSSQEYIIKSLMNFEDISVREKEVADYLNQNFKLDKSVKLVLDPTLTVDKSVWDKMKTGKFSDEKYVLVYAARVYQKDPNAIMNQAKSIADKLGCKVKTLDLHTATDFVDLISNAQYVLSSSYHGVVFSLIFNKPLYAILYGDNQDKRYYNLLHLVGAEKMLANIGETLNPQNVDYSPINKNLELLRKKSINFLMGM
jgi:hypothetical protein